jgi:uncharacterized protein (TIGR02145 family)
LENNSQFGTSGFTALPAGARDRSSFYGLGYIAQFWSATENGSKYAWYRYLISYYSEVGRGYDWKLAGFSVRCLRD